MYERIEAASAMNQGLSRYAQIPDLAPENLWE
jgi:hypothetical protein